MTPLPSIQMLAIAGLAETAYLALRHAMIGLPLAALLGAAMAFRIPGRRSVRRSPAVIHTQIILAVVGAGVMIIIGDSVARAFGILGAAGLVRYRAYIDDPKDAGVMLSTLALGLAVGVGQYLTAVFGAVFFLAVLWVLESFEPEAFKIFDLRLTGTDTASLQRDLEALLGGFQIPYELRGSSPEELEYEVKLPVNRRTERLSNLILKRFGSKVTAVEWEEKKKKFPGV